MVRVLRNNWWLILIVLLAAVLRLYKLGDFPQALKWDEAALGYNAYSILKTARDEYGSFLPIVFKSFGDFKPGLYVYLAVPSVAIFGLSELATRLPSALLGVLIVVAVYFLIKRLLGSKQGLWVALALAISPWHIEFSRGAWEANVAVFLVVIGFLTFLEGVKRHWFLLLSAFLFGLTFLTYQGAKIFTPLLLLGLLFFFSKEVGRVPRKILFACSVILLILSGPVFFGMLRGEGGRARVMSVFSYPRTERETQEILSQDQASKNSLIFRLFHSNELSFTRGIMERYFNHFSGRFLFFEGDWSNKRLGVPDMGVLYLADLAALLFGVYYLVTHKKNTGSNLIFYWLLISPIPAALTRDIISAVRSLNMIIPLTIIIGLGICQLITMFQNYTKIVKLALCFILFLVYGWSLVYFLDQYYVHAPIYNAPTSQYGYREVITFIAPIKQNYKKVIFTQKYGQPYIYWLFYTKYDPSLYQKKARLTESLYGDVGVVEQLDNVEFRDVDVHRDRELSKAILIGNEFDLSMVDVKQVLGATVLKEINFPDGKLAFRAVSKD